MMKLKRLTPIPMESILNNYCNIRDQMRIDISEEDRDYLLKQFDIADWEIDEVLSVAVITTPVDAFNKTITPAIWEEDDE